MGTKTMTVTSGSTSKEASCSITVDYSAGSVDSAASSAACTINWPKNKALEEKVTVWVVVGELGGSLTNVKVKFTLSKKKNKNPSTTKTKSVTFTAQPLLLLDLQQLPGLPVRAARRHLQAPALRERLQDGGHRGPVRVPQVLVRLQHQRQALSRQYQAHGGGGSWLLFCFCISHLSEYIYSTGSFWSGDGIISFSLILFFLCSINHDMDMDIFIYSA